MINRSNWKSVKAYLAYREKVDQVSINTIKADEGRLKHLLLWADEVPFQKAPRIQPPLSEYLKEARLDEKDKPLSRAYTTKIVRVGIRFFKWLRSNRRGYKAITPTWLATLKPPRTSACEPIFRAVSFEEICNMAQAPAKLLWEMRIRAAAVFMFLSGIRVGALVSLPLAAVDLDSRSVKQWPSLGVRTKFSKHATTYLLNVPELNSVIEDWDQLVRSTVPEDGYWFAPFNTLEGGFDIEVDSIGQYRHVRVHKDLKRWLESVGLPYRSPHQFRHGHAVYALTQAQDIADLKAVSMNLMHSNLSITDGVYGVISQQDISRRIQGLGKSMADQQFHDAKDLQAQLERLEQLMLLSLERSGSLQPDTSDVPVIVPNYPLDRLSDGQLQHRLEQ